MRLIFSQNLRTI